MSEMLAFLIYFYQSFHLIPLVSKSEHFWKKNSEKPDLHRAVFYTYDASDATDQKHGFQKFWTLNSKNGAKWTLGTTLDDLCNEKFQHSCFILTILANPWKMGKIGLINVVYECPLDYNQHKFFLYFATFLILNSMQLINKRNK